MDKTVEQVLKAFSHVARELQIYFIPGFLVLINASAINVYFYGNSYKVIFVYPGIWLVLIILAYVFGHLSIAFYYVTFELTGIEKVINKWLKFNYKLEANLLPRIYNNDKEAYFHFIERYSILTLMRCAMSSAFFITTLTNSFFLYIKPFNDQFWTLTVLCLISSAMLLILTCKTESDYAEKIKSMIDSVPLRDHSV